MIKLKLKIEEVEENKIVIKTEKPTKKELEHTTEQERLVAEQVAKALSEKLIKMLKND